MAQTLSGTGSTTFNQVDINNTSGGVKLTSGTYLLNSVINPLSGNFNTNGQSFTMQSSSSKTARIGQVAASASLSGNFIIQRYLSSRNATYADLSSTVQVSTINDWDTELPAISYTHAPPASLASAYTYDETGDAYVAITSAAAPLIPGKGYEVFLAGDYSYASLPNTTMDAIGVPNQGNKNLSTLISNNVQGWNLVGNPFASNVSWASIYAASGSAASGLYDYIEMYDYTIADWHGYTSASAIEIGSAQGFWVYGLPGATTLSLIVPETSKTTTSNSTIKTASLLEDYFTLKMSNEEGNLAHTFKIAANSNSLDGLDNNDLPFRYSPNKATPALYTIIEGKKSNVNSFNSNNDSYAIQLKSEVGVEGNYKMEAAGFDFISEYTCVILEDKLSHKMINLKKENAYSFNSKTTDSPDRFIVHLSKNNFCSNTLMSSKIVTDFENEVNVTTTTEGNLVNFSFAESTPVVIEVMNMLGQDIISAINVVGNTQSEKVVLPAGFSGVYLLKISSEKGTIVKKFYK